MKKQWQSAVKVFFRFTGFSVCFSVILVVLYSFIPVPWTPLMFFREMGSELEDDPPLKHEWISGENIPASMELAVVCTEDQRFLTHYGFDLESIQKAMDEADEGGRTRGASTISQQTAKNVFLWPSSSWIRKGFEVWFTLLIETFWSKERILTVYLNSIEFGPHIYGCEAAAQKFFNKPARDLSAAQSARLAVVLPNPLRYNAGKPGRKQQSRERWALQQMANYGYDIENTRVNGEPSAPKKRKKK